MLEEDGRRLTQTAPILLKLAEQYGRFGGENAEEKFEILRWLFWDNHKLTGYMAAYRYYRTFMPTPDQHVLAHFRKRLDELSWWSLHDAADDFADRPVVDRPAEIVGAPSLGQGQFQVHRDLEILAARHFLRQCAVTGEEMQPGERERVRGHAGFS